MEISTTDDIEVIFLLPEEYQIWCRRACQNPNAQNEANYTARTLAAELSQILQEEKA